MSNQSTERSFGRRLWWIIRTTIASLLLIVVLAGLVYGGFLLFTEVQRSFTSLDIRLNSVERNQNLIREEVDEFRRINPVLEVQVTNLDENLNQMDDRLDLLEESLSADLTALNEALAGLEGETGTLTEDTAAISEAIAALQSDISTNTTDIDGLGGELDTIAGSLEALDADVADIATSQAALLAELPDAQYVQETLVLFQLWELIGRARLRLLENNIGLASEDVAAARLRAELALDSLTTAVAPAEDEAVNEADADEGEGDLPSEADILAGVASRLALAGSNLPENPDLATADLEVAWDALDAILVARLQPSLAETPGPDEGLTAEEDNVDAVEEDTAEPVEEESETEAAEEEETAATPTPAAPTATPAPSPTPSPTPSG